MKEIYKSILPNDDSLVEEILDLKLNDDEKLKFKNSADSVREMNESLGQNL